MITITSEVSQRRKSLETEDPLATDHTGDIAIVSEVIDNFSAVGTSLQGLYRQACSCLAGGCDVLSSLLSGFPALEVQALQLCNRDSNN